MMTSEALEQLKKRFLAGTTCRAYQKLFHISDCGQYVIFKHESHSSYIDRSVGSKTCRTAYYLYRVTDENKGAMLGKDYLFKWEGRWKKSNLSVIETIKKAEETKLNISKIKRGK